MTSSIAVTTALQIAYGAGGTSASVDTVVANLIAEINKHILQNDYPHPDFTNATAVSTVAAPAATYLMRRDASGGYGSTSQVTNALLNANARTVNLPSGLQVASYNVDQIVSNGTQVYGVDQYGNLTLAGLLNALGALLTGTTATNAASVLGIKAPPSPSTDIFWVGDNGGTQANRYVRVAGSGGTPTLGALIARLGLWTGASGSEIFSLDPGGNVLTRRSHREFLVTFSGSTLTITVGTGKYVDYTGQPYNKTSTTNVTVTSHATLNVWWCLSWQVGGTIRAVANTAGGNATAGSAVQAVMANPSDEIIGWVLVPPNVTNLSGATFDDYRGAKTGDGNTGGGGGVSTSTTSITDLDESGTLTNSKKLGNIAAGLTTVTGPTGLVTATTLAQAIRSGFRSSSDYDNSLADRLFNDNNPSLAASMSMSGTLTLTLAAAANSPQVVHVAGRWRSVSSNLTAATSGTGLRYLIADLSGNGPGFTISWSSSNTVGSFQKVIAQGYCNGTTVTPLDTSPIQKMGYGQYTPFLTSNSTNPSGNSASAITSLAGGPSLTINVAGASIGLVNWAVNWTGAVTGYTRYELIANANGGGYAGLLPYGDVNHTAASTENTGTVGFSLPVQFAAGQTLLAISGLVVSGTGVTPVNAFISAFIFGA